jgi:hypothetical protein
MSLSVACTPLSTSHPLFTASYPLLESPPPSCKSLTSHVLLTPCRLSPSPFCCPHSRFVPHSLMSTIVFPFHCLFTFCVNVFSMVCVCLLCSLTHPYLTSTDPTCINNCSTPPPPPVPLTNLFTVSGLCVSLHSPSRPLWHSPSPSLYFTPPSLLFSHPHSFLSISNSSSFKSKPQSHFLKILTHFLLFLPQNPRPPTLSFPAL